MTIKQTTIARTIISVNSGTISAVKSQSTFICGIGSIIIGHIYTT